MKYSSLKAVRSRALIRWIRARSRAFLVPAFRAVGRFTAAAGCGAGSGAAAGCLSMFCVAIGVGTSMMVSTAPLAPGSIPAESPEGGCRPARTGYVIAEEPPGERIGPIVRDNE